MIPETPKSQAKPQPPLEKYAKTDLPVSLAMRSRWMLFRALATFGIDAFHEKEKTKAIIEHFGFKDMDDATLRLHEALHHHHQETLTVPKGERRKNEKGQEIMFRHHINTDPALIDFIYSRMQAKTYEPPLVGCGRFAYALAKIGEEFGHPLHVAHCKPNYLKGGGHVVSYDETDQVYRDASVYKAYFDTESGQWKKGQPYPFQTNIPKEELHLAHFDEKTKQWVEDKPKTI